MQEDFTVRRCAIDADEVLADGDDLEDGIYPACLFCLCVMADLLVYRMVGRNAGNGAVVVFQY